MDEATVRKKLPRIYTRLLESVRLERQGNIKPYREKRWWEFGENNPIFRRALFDLTRYIATTETTKHRIFQFLPGKTVPDHMVIAIAMDDGFSLAVLSSRAHIQWALRAGGTLEDRPRYNKALVFDPFPFPDPTPEQRVVIADLGEELDATRKTVQAEHPEITLTGLYNLVEKLRAGATLDLVEADTARRARAAIILELHRRLDTAVAAAYGWPADLTPEQIVANLVTLNAERAAEEAAGHVRWLRPDYQRPRFEKAAQV